MICFFRLMTPGSTTVSPETVAPNDASATVLDSAFGIIMVASSFKMSTTKSRTWSTPSSVATAVIDAMMDALRSSTMAGAVVSKTETRNLVSPTAYYLLSMRKSSASENEDTSDLASNISVA